jgi:tetratricopeptide (TPR) repeat protein
MRRLVLVLALLALAGPASTFTTPLRAQEVRGRAADSTAMLLLAADRESREHRGAQALALYEAAAFRDPRAAEAHWKAAREAVDLGEGIVDASARKAMYERATGHAQSAVALAPDDADAHFQLARALGRTALDVGPRDRVRYAGAVREHALRALAISPRHPGALHVLGVWHAEVMRLNAVSRAFARTFLGGQVLGTASWSEAARLLAEAVSIEPTRVVHRLDLARIYRDMGRTTDARREYSELLALPSTDANDERYKTLAKAELRALR